MKQILKHLIMNMKKPVKIFDLGSNTFRITSELINQYTDIVEVHTFEPQPHLALHELENLKHHHPDIKFFHNPVAVWFEDAKLKFFEPKNWGYNFKGSSTILQHDGPESKGMEYEEPYNVDAIDFPKYFQDNASTDTFNVIKMDIEGAEYMILPELLKEPTLQNIDVLKCEYHLDMYKNKSKYYAKFKIIHDDIFKILTESGVAHNKWF